jgi:hypothetical protein
MKAAQVASPGCGLNYLEIPALERRKRNTRPRKPKRASDPQVPGFERLKSELLQAQAVVTADSREPVMMALRAMVDFIEAVPGWERLNLSSPIWTLLGALSDLDRGYVVSMLRPNPVVRNRKPDPTLRKVVKAYAAFGIDILRDSGLSTTEACRVVARVVHGRISLGSRPTTLTWKLIKGWRYRMTKLPPTEQSRHLWEALRREAPEQPLSPQHAKKFVTAKLQQVLAKLPKGALE